jgi:hypothetical protein
LVEDGARSHHMQLENEADSPSRCYVEWSNLDRKTDACKRYTVPAEERELESLRLEWSYLEGRDNYLLRRTQDQDSMLLGERHTYGAEATPSGRG